jgi:hypothetical protein
MKTKKKEEEFELEITISDQDSEMIARLKKIIINTPHKRPTKK